MSLSIKDSNRNGDYLEIIKDKKILLKINIELECENSLVEKLVLSVQIRKVKLRE